MTLWIACALMAAAAAAAVALPMARRGRAPAARDAHALEVHRAQLDEIGRDRERGVIAAEQAEAARAEIGRRILALEDPAPAGAAAPSVPARPVAAALAAFGVPALAAAAYLSLGDPGLPSRAAAAEALRAEAARLAAGLEREPGDPRRWAALGAALTRLKRHGRAAFAYAQAARRDSSSAVYPSLEGEALALAAGGRVTPRAAAALREALRRDADEPRARFYLGLADRQAGRLSRALERWRALAAETPPGAPWAEHLGRRIAAIEAELGGGEKPAADEGAPAARERRAAPRLPAEPADGPPPLGKARTGPAS